MNNSAHKPWKRLSQKTVYKGRMHIVEHATQLPNGEFTTYEVDHGSKGAAAVLVKTSDDKIVLTYQFRFPINKWIYDLPGGAIGKHETPEEAAIRECREEVGIAPQKLEKLAMFYPNPARTDWPAHVFYSDVFSSSKIILDDPSETVEYVLMWQKLPAGAILL